MMSATDCGVRPSCSGVNISERSWRVIDLIRLRQICRYMRCIRLDHYKRYSHLYLNMRYNH